MTTDRYGHPLCPTCGWPLLDVGCVWCAHEAVLRQRILVTTLEELEQVLVCLEGAYPGRLEALPPGERARKLVQALRQYQDGQRCAGCLLGEHAR